MLQQCYVSGFERATFNALGFTLAPLTLGHVAVLALTDNPLLKFGKADTSTVGIHDLVSFVFICSTPRWEDALDAMKNGNMELSAQKYIEDHADKIDLDKGIPEIKAYYDYYLAAPMRDSRESVVRVPWWWAYATWLQTDLNRTEEEAWATICSDAYSYYACAITNAGSQVVWDVGRVARVQQVKSGKTYRQMFKEGLL